MEIQNLKEKAALDNTRLIEKIDQSNMYAYLPSLASDAFESYQKAKAVFSIQPDDIENIVGAGMGGSGQPIMAVGSIFKNELALPLILSQSYDVPGFVNSSTFFLAISHSGETEEIIHQYCHAKHKKAQLAVIAKGGTLLKMAKKDRAQYFTYSTSRPPRASFALMFGAALACLENAGLLPPCQSALHEAVAVVEKMHDGYKKEVEIENNLTKQVALLLETRTPVIYVEPPFDAIGARFSKTFNENAQRFAFYNRFPELRHNEIMCWTTTRNAQQGYVPVFIRDDKHNSTMEQEIDQVKQMIDSNVIELRPTGKSKIARFCSLLFITDMIAYYEAILMEKDPSTTFELNQLKEKLKQLSSLTDYP
jgi:glucose/mannose-6-phosphate isomerase